MSVDLPEPDTPVTATKSPSGKLRRDVAQVVGLRAHHAQHARGIASAGAAGTCTCSSPRR